MYQHDFYIKGENDQGNLRRTLTIQESKSTQAEFFRFLSEMQEYNPYNIYLKTISVEGSKYAFLITSHPDRRIEERTCLNRVELRQRCSELLADPFITSRVTEYPLYMDDDGYTITSGDDTRSGSTAVVDERTNVIYLFEAGFQYIRLVTTWSVKSGVFYADKGTFPIKVRVDGSIEANKENIQEIQVVNKKR